MKGYMGKFIMTLFMLGMFSIAYIGLNEAMENIKTEADTIITNPDSQDTKTLLNLMWVWLPIAVLFSYFIFSITRPERQSGGALR
jgi:hypothetical protein